MKKILYCLWVIVSLSIMASCSATNKNVPASPGEAAVYYLGFMRDGEFDKLLDGYYYGPDMSDLQIETGKENLRKAYASTGKSAEEFLLEEFGGMKIKLIDEKILGTDDAHVKFQLTYPDGSVEYDEYDMKKENGVWKIVIPI